MSRRADAALICESIHDLACRVWLQDHVLTRIKGFGRRAAPDGVFAFKERRMVPAAAILAGVSFVKARRAFLP